MKGNVHSKTIQDNLYKTILPLNMWKVVEGAEDCINWATRGAIISIQLVKSVSKLNLVEHLS